MTRTPSPINRREFVRRSVHTGLAAGFLAGAARGYAAHDTIRVAVLGSGGRARQLMAPLRRLPNVRIVAVCDIWEHALQEGLKLAEPDAVAYRDYREALDHKDCDAVLIGSPDHWHVPMAADACAAGKDVYVEKPLTHSLDEGARIIDAQNRHQRIVQVGQQQRSMTHLRRAYDEIVRPGKLGRVHQVRIWWNRNGYGLSSTRPAFGVDPKTLDWKAFCGSAPAQPFDEYRFRQWRWFWDFGGGILTDLMTHFIDVVHWYMDTEGPQAASASGGLYFCGQKWETPDTINVLLTYPDKRSVVFHGTFSNGYGGAGIEFQGSQATLYVDRGRYELHPIDAAARPDVVVSDELPKGTDLTRDYQDETHLRNWIECMRSRQKPVCPAEVGVSAAAASHMGNIAYRTGKVFTRPAAR